jgi:hypothetical protein
MIGKAYGWVTFSKCGARFGYHLILGPLLYGFTLYFFILSIWDPWTYFSERGWHVITIKVPLLRGGIFQFFRMFSSCALRTVKPPSPLGLYVTHIFICAWNE